MKNSRFMRLITLLTAALLCLGVLAGCAASGNSVGDMAPGSSDDKFTAGGTNGAPSEEWNPGELGGEYERKIIRTVNMSCETLDYDGAVTVIMQTLAASGGYVEASSVSGSGAGKSRSADSSEGKGTYASPRRANYTLRVPAEKLDGFLEALRADSGIRILSQSMESDEITSSYYDTKARLDTLAAEKASLTAMLEGFTDYSDISAMLQVQERLYNVIEEMEALQTKLNLYDGQVALSTVYLSLSEVVTYTPMEEPTFGERIAESFIESWTAFGRGCQNFAVWFVRAFPTLLVLGVIACAVLFIIRRVRRKKRLYQVATPTQKTETDR